MFTIICTIMKKKKKYTLSHNTNYTVVKLWVGNHGHNVSKACLAHQGLEASLFQKVPSLFPCHES